VKMTSSWLETAVPFASAMPGMVDMTSDGLPPRGRAPTCSKPRFLPFLGAQYRSKDLVQ